MARDPIPRPPPATYTLGKLKNMMTTTAARLHLGYEIGTGTPVSIPLHHLAVTGLTRLAGKTTAIEGLLSRLPPGMKSLVFRTKRGEVAFDGAHSVTPFYRQQTDWEYVESLLEAAMKEKLRLERSFIIRACKGAESLRDVYEHISSERSQARRGFDESVWTNLQAYFEKILPELETNPFSETLDLTDGLNVMDLGHLPEEVQALVISACLDHIWQEGRDTIVVIPEAWAFLPQQRGNPVKWAAQHVIREGGAVGVYLYLDSQDITGIDKSVLKSVDIWLLGRQREKNEVQRVLEQIPTKNKPTADAVMTLPIGHFFVAAEDWIKEVYAQPSWSTDDEAAEHAKSNGVGTGTPAVSVEQPPPPAKTPNVPTQLEEVATLRRQLNNERRQLEGALEKEEEAMAALGEARDTIVSLEERLRPLETFVNAFRDVIGDNNLVGTTNRGMEAIGPQHIASIARQVAEYLGPGHGTTVVAPLEAMKAKYQQEAIERLMQIIAGLDKRQRRALELLVAVDKPTRYTELATELGYRADGGSYSTFSQGIKEMIKVDLVKEDGHGLRAGLKSKLCTVLARYNPPADILEDTYAHLLAALNRPVNEGPPSTPTAAG